MTGSAGANLLISGVGDMAAAITGKNFCHALKLLELRLRTPKAPGGKSRRIQPGRRNGSKERKNGAKQKEDPKYKFCHPPKLNILPLFCSPTQMD